MIPLALASMLLLEADAGARTAPDPVEDLARLADVAVFARSGFSSTTRALDGRRNVATLALGATAAPALRDVRGGLDAWFREEDLARGHASSLRLRQAYVATTAGPLDVQIGRQIVVWGRADKLNPTDNLAPRDFTLLGPDDDDQRLGTWASRATAYAGRHLSFTGIWLPVYTPHRIAIPPLPLDVTVESERTRAAPWQWAAKVDWSGGAVDASVSYFDGLDLAPDVGLSQTGIVLTGSRIRVVGCDAATSLGGFGLRAEAAYTLTGDEAGTNPFVKNPFLYVVAGADRSIADGLNVNAQLVYRFVAGWRDPAAVTDSIEREVAIAEAKVSFQRDRHQEGLAVRLSGKWLDGTLEAEVLGVAFVPRRDYLVRPRIAYRLSDRWKIVGGGDLYGGPDDSSLGRLRRNSGLHSELQGSFQ